MEQENINTYLSESSIEDTLEEPPQESYSFLEGICNRCLDTGFVHTVRDGVLGILYTSFDVDSFGNPTKKLMVCDHNRKVNC